MSFWECTCNDVNAPPLQRFAKIVWMAGNSPETFLAYCTLFLGIIAMHLELVVGQGFDEEASKPDGRSVFLEIIKVTTIYGACRFLHYEHCACIHDH